MEAVALGRASFGPVESCAFLCAPLKKWPDFASNLANPAHMTSEGRPVHRRRCRAGDTSGGWEETPRRLQVTCLADGLNASAWILVWPRPAET